jgi:hypothetical protein
MSKKMKVKIGKGLFSNEPIPVVVDQIFGDPTFLLTPLTFREAIELAGAGLDMQVTDTPTIETLAAMQGFFEKFVHGWSGLIVDGEEVEYTAKHRDRLAGTQVFGILVGEATDLGVEVLEVEEKNSETSSPGTSEPVTSP